MEISEAFARPLVGIFVFEKQLSRLLRQQSNKKVLMLKKANEVARTTLFYFSLNSVDYESRQIKGVHYNTDSNKWEAVTFPYPDVIYSRRRDSALRFRNNEHIMQIKNINNQYYFDKWDVCKTLMKNVKIRPHIPYTKLYRQPHDLKIVLKAAKKVYLKSFKQNNGSGVMYVEKTSKDSHYKYSYFKNGRVVMRRVDCFNALLKKVKQFFGKKNFLIQQAIDLVSVNGNIADIRSDVQRNGAGKLEFVAHSVRIGSNNSPITNTKAKPHISQFEDFFREQMKFSEEMITALRMRMESLLMQIYEELELSYGDFGEMGIDIGIDKNGDIWFIESNAKPGKNSFWVYQEDVVLRGFLNPLEYARHIYNRT